MHERLKQLKEEIKLYDGQIANQETQTATAKATLAEAESEMKLIKVEQQDLMTKWKSALLGMANRDTAKEAAEAVDSVIVPDFEPRKDAKIVTDEKATSLTTASVDDATVINDLIAKLERCRHNLSPDFRMKPVQFEKVNKYSLI